MDATIKAQWIKDLRSGNFKQGTGKLRQRTPSGDRYCCLGVLCEQAVKAGVVTRSFRSDGVVAYGEKGARQTQRNAAVLPDAVMVWAGLTEDNPSLNGRALSLAYANDSGHDFDEIANLIDGSLFDESNS